MKCANCYNLNPKLKNIKIEASYKYYNNKLKCKCFEFYNTRLEVAQIWAMSISFWLLQNLY